MPSLLASPPFRLLAVSCLLPVLYGCVSTATVSRLRPAEAGVVGVYRVGVLPLIGPEQQAPEAQQALLETVNETGRYQLVTADQMQQAAPGPLIGPDGDIDRRVAMEAGWRLGVDAILIGSVQLTEEGWSETGSVRMIIGSPTLRAVCQLELIDVRSGMTLFAGGGEAAEKLDVGDSPVSSNVRMHIGQRLACRSVVAAARRITPHQVSTDVALSSDLFGKGSVALWRGNYLAREGRWDEAQQQWLTALAENPENDAA
ncbi:MAG: hypothetical protein JJ992_27660, partial [Planctomycetes bacterium]|nr:hypothetical protein [Planctomycetota bacterium]